jgi:hypothetical protein
VNDDRDGEVHEDFGGPGCSQRLYCGLLLAIGILRRNVVS